MDRLSLSGVRAAIMIVLTLAVFAFVTYWMFSHPHLMYL